MEAGPGAPSGGAVGAVGASADRVRSLLSAVSEVENVPDIDHVVTSNCIYRRRGYRVLQSGNFCVCTL